PLRFGEWGLLVLGLCPLLSGELSLWALVPVALLLALGYRRTHPLADPIYFNASQVAVGTVAAFCVGHLVRAVATSLSSPPPRMVETLQLTGVPYGGDTLAWISDRAAQVLPHVTVVS